MRKLKVYGWCAHISNPERSWLGMSPWVNQCRCIVAAPSKAEVGRLVDRDPRQLFNLGETGNAKEIKIAMEKPLTFFAAPLDGGKSFYIEVPPEAVS